MKHLLDKIEENAKFIETKRKKVNYNFLVNNNEVDAWETNIKTDGTPLSKYYDTLKKQKDNKNSMKQIDEVKLLF